MRPLVGPWAGDVPPNGPPGPLVRMTTRPVRPIAVPRLQIRRHPKKNLGGAHLDRAQAGGKISPEQISSSLLPRASRSSPHAGELAEPAWNPGPPPVARRLLPASLGRALAFAPRTVAGSSPADPSRELGFRPPGPSPSPRSRVSSSGTPSSARSPCVWLGRVEFVRV
jgi:hypothetical protein